MDITTSELGYPVDPNLCTIGDKFIFTGLFVSLCLSAGRVLGFVSIVCVRMLFVEMDSRFQVSYIVSNLIILLDYLIYIATVSLVNFVF